MEYLETEDAKPGSCRRAGLDCETCIGQTARGVAALCRSLSEAQQRDAFRRLYPDPCCQLVLADFLTAYRREVAQSEEADLELVPVPA